MKLELLELFRITTETKQSAEEYIVAQGYPWSDWYSNQSLYELSSKFMQFKGFPIEWNISWIANNNQAFHVSPGYPDCL